VHPTLLKVAWDIIILIINNKQGHNQQIVVVSKKRASYVTHHHTTDEIERRVPSPQSPVPGPRRWGLKWIQDEGCSL
jgi:hypothetical protein